MKAKRIFYYKSYQGEIIVEMVIWLLPESTKERPHGLKYRLFCGRSNDCVIRYDNEAGKGDHVHYGLEEQYYCFSSVEQLLIDFRNDCEQLANWRWE